MYVATSRSDPAARPQGVVPDYLRARGALRCRFAARPRGTEAVETAESGGFRVRFPRVGRCEAVMINTGGGMTGGDRLDVTLDLDAGADAVVTTQSCEKVYRAQHAPAQVSVRATLAAGARLAWLPQETILFSGSRLSRRFDVDLDPSATLTLAESLVFGRLAMGETLGPGLLADRWRVRRGGRLVFAENLRLDGDLTRLLDRPALGGGARAVATILHVAPDAEARLEAARAALEAAGSDCGASAWGGLLVVRFAAPSPAVLRGDLSRFLAAFRDTPPPRVWQC
ncbi:urease accessory protein UreD [Alsobacter sp. SYSU M60028]|uniref:Urease accessory protein UreD n=1 Tax=Alsobacter ponti TaxID=2962936 RepID=A0ABT1LIU9_9HYPH|nr:urease accessory protein UreD [Alsobacter ponti]MCP8940640.1 urease accessory protein UreD [Alsobacter ponti]